MNQAALAGVKVLEYCQMVFGPYCAKLLADLGAEVMKNEKPVIGGPVPSRGPGLPDIPYPTRSGLFPSLTTD